MNLLLVLADPVAAPAWGTIAADAITRLTPLVVPLLVYYFRQLIPRVKPALLPVLAIALGIALDAVNQYATGGGKGAVVGAVLGLAGIGLRELADQLTKKGDPSEAWFDAKGIGRGDWPPPPGPSR